MKFGDKCVTLRDIVTYGKELNDGTRILVPAQSLVTFKSSRSKFSFIVTDDGRIHPIRHVYLEKKVSEIELKDLTVLDYFIIDGVKFQYKGKTKAGLHKFTHPSPPLDPVVLDLKGKPITPPDTEYTTDDVGVWLNDIKKFKKEESDGKSK